MLDAWLVRSTDPLIDFATRLDIEDAIVGLLADRGRGWVLAEHLAGILQQLVAYLDPADPWVAHLLREAESEQATDETLATSMSGPEWSPWAPVPTVDAAQGVAAALNESLDGRRWAELYSRPGLDRVNVAVVGFQALDTAIRVVLAHAWTQSPDVNPSVLIELHIR